MKNNNQLKILLENKELLENSVRWLKRSFAICKENFDLKPLFEEVLKNCPLVFDFVENTLHYTDNLAEKLNK